MIGEAAIRRFEEARNAGESGRREQRPGPPDLAREISYGFGPAKHLAIGRDDSHFAKQIRGRQIEESLHARILQSGKAEAALFQGAAEAASKRGADAAVAVEENPAADGVPSFYISYF